ncbi:uncharacterized protein HaLaN_30644, partial [Haematococcus lacustris]
EDDASGVYARFNKHLQSTVVPGTAPKVSLAAFGVHSAMGYSLTAAIAFPALALFNLLRFPIIMYVL